MAAPRQPADQPSTSTAPPVSGAAAESSRAVSRVTTWLLAALVLLSLGLYAPSLGNELVWDAEGAILHDPSIRDLANVPGFFTTGDVLGDDAAQAAPGASNLEYYRPLTKTLHLLEYRLFGATAWPYKAVSVLLNAWVVALAFLLVLEVSRSPRVAALAGLLFAVNPTHSEAVCWVQSDSNLLMAACVLSAFLAYVRGRRRTTLVYFALALFSRETAVLFPLVLGLYELCVRRSRRPADYRWVGASLGMALGFVVLRSAVVGPVPLTSASPLVIATTVAWGVAKSAKLLLWPDGPVSVYVNRAGMFAEWNGEIAAAWAVLGCVLVLAVLLLRRRSPAVFWLGWFLVWPAATYNAGSWADYALAEKTLYLASLGPAVLVALGLSRLPRRWLVTGLLTGLVCAVAAAQLVVTFRRTAHWKDSPTYLAGLVAFEPEFGVGWIALGNSLRERDRFAEAIEAYREARRMRPDLEELAGVVVATEFERGIAAATGKDFVTARDAFAAVTEADPEHVGAWTNLGNVHLVRGEHGEARTAFERAIAISPQDPLPHYNLGLTLEALGDTAGALEQFRAYATLAAVVPTPVRERIERLEDALRER